MGELERQATSHWPRHSTCRTNSKCKQNSPSISKRAQSCDQGVIRPLATRLAQIDQRRICCRQVERSVTHGFKDLWIHLPAQAGIGRGLFLLQHEQSLAQTCQACSGFEMANVGLQTPNDEALVLKATLAKYLCRAANLNRITECGPCRLWEHKWHIQLET